MKIFFICKVGQNWVLKQCVKISAAFVTMGTIVLSFALLGGGVWDYGRWLMSFGC